MTSQLNEFEQLLIQAALVTSGSKPISWTRLLEGLSHLQTLLRAFNGCSSQPDSGTT